jgi:GTP-binding protein HflX
MNALTGANTRAENQLFATLDTLTRRMETQSTTPALLIDTVGFIRKLPHHLVESFKATLGDIAHADLCLHVIDASHPGHAEQMKVADATLHDIQGRDRNKLYVFNKIDAIEGETVEGLRLRYPDAVFISAERRDGLDELKRRIDQALFGRNVEVEVRIRAVDGKRIATVKSLLQKPKSSMRNGFCILKGRIDSKHMDSLDRLDGIKVRYLL